MKNKNFKRFTQRSNLKKRSDRDRQKRELLKIAEQIGVRTEGCKVSFSNSASMHRSAYSTDRVSGIFRESSNGYGFVTSEEYEYGDIFIPASAVGSAVDSDEVEISFREYSGANGERRTEGKILRILSEVRKTLIGTAVVRQIKRGRRREDICYLTPDGVRSSRDIVIKDAYGVSEGDKILVKIRRESVRCGYMQCELLDNFGPADTKDANYLAILSECGIPTEFSKEELDIAKALAAEKISDVGRRRINSVVFTIDSETAKDLDDAISIERTEQGYTLGVHIADVSHYVREKTALDRAVMARGTSVYFTDKVIPMLPESLSNGACSLNAGEDKYALSSIIDLSHDGKIIGARLESTVIRSRVQGIYSEINQIFDNTASEEILDKYKDCLESLSIMRELYGILSKNATERGSLDLESEEAYIVLDESGAPVDIIKRKRGDAEKLIEQFMLTANEAVATLTYEKNIPCVYRVHSAPPEEKREDFIEYSSNLGLFVKGIAAEGASAKDYSALLSEAKEKGLGFAVSYAMLRSMSKAEYSEVKKPHFGLAIDTYCHFTSPIRRLSDLATHRIIKAVLLGDKAPERYRGYAKRAAAAASDCEVRAEGAERRIENLYKVIYMKEHIGEVFPARISGVASHGAYALLDNTCEGLIPITELGAGAIFEEKNLSIRAGERVYRIGHCVNVRLDDADISSGKLRFSLVESNNGDEV